jgi:DNA-directed RNA polymerase specialized sigma24 family protein
MRTIIARHCRQVLRRTRRSQSHHTPFDQTVHQASVPGLRSEWNELLQAINRLDEPDRTALTLLLKGYNKTEVSCQMNLTYERTRYVIERALKMLSVMIGETSESNS